MLIAKGYSVRFILDSGHKFSAPRGAALLHDPSGKDWPACAGLVLVIQRAGEEISDSKADDYFGSQPMKGRVALPPKSLSDWKRLGMIDEIEYSRRRPRGLPADNKGDYFHPFKGDAVLHPRRRADPATPDSNFFSLFSRRQ